jgi:hypothetical protein
MHDVPHCGSKYSMNPDVDLLRDIILMFERAERSPPEAIFLSLDELSATTGRGSDLVEAALIRLDMLRFIDGPGRYRNGWLFRKLTPKGRFLAKEIRNKNRWAEIKKHYSLF